MERTQVCIESLKCSLEDAASPWQRVLAEAAEKRSLAAHLPALLVIVAATDEHGVRSMRSFVKTTSPTSPTALIIGAHAHCDVPDVLGASLRHIALWIDPVMTPGWVHAIDLNTTDGMVVDGEQGIRRVDARCSVRMGAGSADVLAMALAPHESVDLRMVPMFAAPFIPRVRAVAFAGGAEPARPQARGARPARPMRSSRDGVTMVSLVSELADAALSPLVLRPTTAELERGFILGRYERCTSQLDDGRVSRVHALVVGRGEQILVIDTASTNGTDVYPSPSPGPPKTHARAARLRQKPSHALGILHRAAAVQRGIVLDLGGTVVEVR